MKKKIEICRFTQAGGAKSVGARAITARSGRSTGEVEWRPARYGGHAAAAKSRSTAHGPSSRSA